MVSFDSDRFLFVPYEVAPRIKSAMQRMLGVRLALSGLRQELDGLRQQLVSIQQSLGAIYLDINVRRETLNETTAANQAMQLLLRQKYRALQPPSLARVAGHGV